MNQNYDRVFRIFANIVLVIASLSCIYPLLLLIMSSFTDEMTLVVNGYSVFPAKFSLAAYEYLFVQAGTLSRAYGITLLITAVGTAAGMLITALLSYVLAQPVLPGKKVLSFLVVFSMLFNGGLVSTYLWYVNYLHMKNTIWALLVPGLLSNGFLIMVACNYFRSNVPMEVTDAARIDGAGEFRIFFSIVIPFSQPILAALGMMQGIGYWNDWRNGLYYITDTRLFSIQNLLNRMLQEITFLSTTDTSNFSADYFVNLPSTSVRMAIAVVAALPILMIYPFFQKFFAKGLTIGSLKG